MPAHEDCLRLVLYSAIIREASSCSRWEQIQRCTDTMQRVRDFGSLSSKGDVSIKSLSSGLKESSRRGGRRNVGTRGMEDAWRTRSPKSTEQGSMNSETEAVSTGPVGLCTRPLAYILQFQSSTLTGFLNM
ncbi:hypothetical protein LEMLEM_LOCUS23248 [Lemmus lemmus]